MPVTLKPNGDLKSHRVHRPRLNGFAKSAHDILTAKLMLVDCPWEADVLQSSYTAADFDKLVAATLNGLVDSILLAWSKHHHLRIRPDDVWCCILAQVSAYINRHAEELRDKFVSHQGKQQLEIMYDTTSLYTIDFALFANDMRNLLKTKLMDPELVKWTTPSFTTTTDTDVVVASITLMAMMKKYYDYKGRTGCGFPSVTLLGERADYEDILHRLEKLKEWGEEPMEFGEQLRPILKRFVQSFDEPNHEDVTDFWSRSISRHRASGVNRISGWLTAFCFWTNEGIRLKLNFAEADIDGYHAKPYCEAGGERRYSGYDFVLTLDDQIYGSVDFLDIPSAAVTVPVKLEDKDVEIDAVMVAGSMAMTCIENPQGEPMENGQVGIDCVQPSSGWWIYQRPATAIRK